LASIDIDILSTGEIRFCRCDSSTNESLLEFLSELVDDPKLIAEIEEFLDGGGDIEHILGNEPLCG